MYREEGLKRGFTVVESGPLVRSSYHAEEQVEKLTPERKAVVEGMTALIERARANVIASA